MTQRLLLDTLGLGNRQVFQFLSSQRPDRIEFEHWILETAGLPHPHRLARYQTKMGAAVLSPGAEADLAEIEQGDEVLTSAQLQHWSEAGYVVLPRAISKPECEEVADALWSFLGANPDNPESWYGLETDGIMVELYQHPSLEHARQSKRIWKAFAQLWGSADLWCTIDQLGFNPPERDDYEFRGSGLHWDVSLVRPIPFATQAVLYLTDTDSNQGAFRCVPGFHNGIEGWFSGLEGQAPRDVDLETDACTVPGQAGDLVIWRQDLPHGASPNRATTPRLVQYLNYYSPELKAQSEWM